MKLIRMVLIVASLSFFAAKLVAEDGQGEALAAFHEGVALYNEAKFAEAAKAFRRANTLKSNWKILFNIGQCESAAKHYGLALQAFEEYLARGGDDVPANRRDEVVMEIGRLKVLVGLLEIEAPHGADVYIDNVKRGQTPLSGPILLSAGIPHDIRVELDGTVVLHRELRMVGGQTKSLRVPPPDATPAPSAVSEDAEENGAQQETPVRGKRPLLVVGVSTLAVGVGTAVTGLALGGVALAKGNSLDETYPDGVPPGKSGEIDTVDNLALSADILIGVGAAATVAGVVLIVLHHVRGESTVGVAPAVSSEWAGAVIRGTF